MRLSYIVKSSEAFLFLLLAVMALWMGGCATAESDNMSERPWNTPKGWETGLPMGLNEGR
jgi:hypothetical protein